MSGDGWDIVRPGLWRTNDGQWEAERRDMMDVRPRDWVLRDQDGVVDGPVNTDWASLTEIKDYVASQTVEDTEGAREA